MTIPYPVDPSLPSNPSPLFSDASAARGDHLRSNNSQIWANIDYIVATILGNAVLSTDGTMAANSDLKFPSEKAVRAYFVTYFNSLLPVGFSGEYSGITIPAGWMKEDGSSLLRADYGTLFSALTAVVGAVSISIASPGLLIYNLHPFKTGDCIHLTTSGALPTGLSANTNYYVIVNDNNTFWIATTYANALAGTKINTSGTQSGTHTLTWIPWGAADATHFYLPDTQGLSTEGSGQLTTNGAAWGGANYKGRLGQYKQDVMFGHRHTATNASGGGVFGFNNGGTYPYTPSVGASPIYTVGDIIDDGIHGAPRIDYITNGPRVGKWKIIKVI